MITGKKTRNRVLGRTILVILVTAAYSASLLAAPRYFIARFQNRLSPHLEDLDQAFVVGDGLISSTFLQPTPMIDLGILGGCQPRGSNQRAR